MAAPEDMRGTHDISQRITTAPVTLGKVEIAFICANRTRPRPSYPEMPEGFEPFAARRTRRCPHDLAALYGVFATRKWLFGGLPSIARISQQVLTGITDTLL
jgi:hypothetical protein